MKNNENYISNIIPSIIKSNYAFWFLPVGLAIYFAILITTFVKTWELFSVYIDKRFAFGVAIGFDVMVLYYSILSVLYPNRWTKITSILSGILLWVIILFALIRVWEIKEINTSTIFTVKNVVAFIISLFIPLTSVFLGKVIGSVVSLIFQERIRLKEFEEKNKIPFDVEKILNTSGILFEEVPEYNKILLSIPKEEILTKSGKYKKKYTINIQELLGIDTSDESEKENEIDTAKLEDYIERIILSFSSPKYVNTIIDTNLILKVLKSSNIPNDVKEILENIPLQLLVEIIERKLVEAVLKKILYSVGNGKYKITLSKSKIEDNLIKLPNEV